MGIRLSNQQINKTQSDETKLQETKNKISNLHMQFDQNRKELKSVQINKSIKKEIIRIKKSPKTSYDFYS